MRRRFEKSLNDFKLNEETLQYYQMKVDSILNYIKGQLNPPKKKKEIDGKRFYENLKKKEKKNG